MARLEAETKKQPFSPFPFSLLKRKGGQKKRAWLDWKKELKNSFSLLPTFSLLKRKGGAKRKDHSSNGRKNEKSALISFLVFHLFFAKKKRSSPKQQKLQTYFLLARGLLEDSNRPLAFSMTNPIYPFSRSHSASLKPTRTKSSPTTSGRLTSMPLVASRASCSSSLMVGSLSLSPCSL